MNAHGTSWWKVTIVDGRNWHNRDWLLTRIKDLCRVPFREINFHVYRNDLVFFVNNGAVAGALVDTSNRIKTRDGSRVVIQVSASYNPWGRKKSNFDRTVILNKDMMEQLKICLGHRYETSSSKLNLSGLFHDPILKNARIDGYVTNPSFMNKVFDVIHSVCPKLKVLDLSRNNICKLDILIPLSEKCPELDELILSDNDIRFTDELSNINDHKKITKLWLKGNPLGLQSFGCEVREHLPMLKFLDGAELPSRIGFGIGAEIRYHVPDRKDVYSANRNDLELVKIFVQNYFQWYDHFDPNRRDKLLHIYDNDAMFSMCCNSNLESSIKLNLPRLYVQNNRNFQDGNFGNDRKKSLLIHKKVNIITFLTELPTTNHWLDSFSLDLSLATPNMLCFVVQGMFIEGEDETPRGFSRTFIVQRVSNSRLAVLNEQLVIRSLTDKQVLLFEDAKYNNAAAPLAVTINIDDDDDPPEDPLVVQATAQQELVARFAQQLKLIDTCTVTPSSKKVLPLEQQEELALQLTAETKMNITYSKMCLEASNWDYELAVLKFSKLYKIGGIPSEAFVVT